MRLEVDSLFHVVQFKEFSSCINLLALVTLFEYDELGIESLSDGRLTARFGNSLEFLWIPDWCKLKIPYGNNWWILGLSRHSVNGIEYRNSCNKARMTIGVSENVNCENNDKLIIFLLERKTRLGDFL